MRVFRAIAAAFAYFSILPAGAFVRAGAPDADALSALPLVGVTIGALAGGAALFAGALGASVPLAVAAAFATVIVASGALHIDGFLDCCDALFAPVDPARRLEILKDPRHGTFAVAGMALVAIVWTAAGAEVYARTGHRFPIAIAVASCTGRLAAVLDARVFAYARAGEIPAALARKPSLAAFLLATLAAVGFAALLSAWGPLVVAIALAGGIGVGRFAATRLGGGLTGDAYGFVAVTIEVATVAAFALVSS